MMDLYNEQLKNNYIIQRNVIFNAIANAHRQNNSVIPLFEEEVEEKSQEEITNEREELFSKKTLTL